MKLLLVTILSTMFVWHSAHSQPLPPWSFTNTGINHTVIIPTNASPSVNGDPLTSGDYVGVFFDSSGALVCAGYVQWTGSNTAVSAFGDDPTTGGKDGLSNLETFKWKIWRHGDGAIFDATATFAPPDGFIVSDTNRFVVNGVSRLASLSGTISIDGDISELRYSVLATKQNSNAGFGSGVDVSKIVLYSNAVDSVLYLGIQGKLDVSTNNAIGVWLNFKGSAAPVGKPAGMPLGILSSGGNYLGGGNNPANVNFSADFETDYLFAFNSGSGSSAVYFDVAKHVGTSVLEYQGSCSQAGLSATNVEATGVVFQKHNITFAFNNSGGVNRGLEIRIPFRAVGAHQADSIEVFACVVSADAFFSDVTVPGTVPSVLFPQSPDANLGYNPNFNTLSGGPYHSVPPAVLPVQLASFSGRYVDDYTVRLEWITISEINNYGFYIHRRAAGETQYTELPNSFVPGHGTTNEPQHYKFADSIVVPGVRIWQYRLKQIDLDGTVHLSEPISVSTTTEVQPRIEIPKVFSLAQNYPNPFNPRTTIEFGLPRQAHIVLEVFDILGRRVASLVNEMRNAGFHQVPFDADGLSSGMYVYRISAGNFVQTKKLLLLR